MLDDLRVLIVADDPLARAGLASLLAGQVGSQVVGQVASQADLLAEVDAAQPDVVLWDLGWDPAPALERLAAEGEELPPVMALLPSDVEDLGYISEAWAAAARGLLLRDSEGQRLNAALAALAQGLVVLDPTLASLFLAGAGPRQGIQEAPVEELTARELEVLSLLAEGLPNKGIGRRLQISDHTVKFHVNAIMGKLGAQSRTEAVVRATRLGLIVL